MQVFAINRKVAPVSTVYRLSSFDFFGSNIIFFKGNFFVDSLLEPHCAHSWPIKEHAFHYFEKLLQKVQSIACLELIFFAPIIFFVIGNILVDSLLKQYCAHFWPIKMHAFALLRKVAPKSIVYSLS